MEDNQFGKLVRAYRKQRGLTQAQLADLWGYTRTYVTQIEAGKRKLDRPSQITRLAELLEIPKERLYAIGRAIPDQEVSTRTPDTDNALLQMLLTPGKDMVRLSWMVWLADQHPAIETNLRRLVVQLDQALTAYRGEFATPARQLLAYAHLMMGKIAFDQLDYAAAGGHFTEMRELGEILHDPDIQALALIHLGDMLRKRNRYEAAIRCLEAARVFSEHATRSIEGMRHLILARGYYCFGDQQQFQRAIETALTIANTVQDSIDNLANQFTLDDVLQEQAAGYTTLWQAEKALAIYQETDRQRPFRPLREQGSYLIDKAQATFHLGNLDHGIRLSEQGIRLAAEYHSKRHISRLEATYQRLMVSPLRGEQQLKAFQSLLRDAHQQEETW